MTAYYRVNVDPSFLARLMEQDHITDAVRCVEGLPPGARLTGAMMTVVGYGSPSQNVVQLSFEAPGEGVMEIVPTFKRVKVVDV